MTAILPQTDDAHLLAGSSLSGQTLYDQAGDKLGVIKDCYIDRVTGQVEFVVGATGGFLGVGEKFHPLPWGLLRYNSQPEGYVVTVGRDAIKNAPAYDRDQLNSAHYGWGEQVRRYFSAFGRDPARV